MASGVSWRLAGFSLECAEEGAPRPVSGAVRNRGGTELCAPQKIVRMFAADGAKVCARCTAQKLATELREPVA